MEFEIRKYFFLYTYLYKDFLINLKVKLEFLRAFCFLDHY